MNSQSTIKKAVQAHIRRERLSVSEVARRAGVSRPHLSLALRGVTSRSVDWWLRVADALDLRVKISVE